MLFDQLPVSTAQKAGMMSAAPQSFCAVRFSGMASGGRSLC